MRTIEKLLFAGLFLAMMSIGSVRQALKQIFNDTDIHHCWLGARRDNQNIWRWISGKIISNYFDWATSSEPKSGKDIVGNDFSIFYVTRDYKGKWYTCIPNHEFEFMCEWDSANDAHESNM